MLFVTLALCIATGLMAFAYAWYTQSKKVGIATLLIGIIFACWLWVELTHLVPDKDEARLLSTVLIAFIVGIHWNWISGLTRL